MGLIGLLTTHPLIFVLVAVIIMTAITIHEFAHAWMADRLGDPTPRYQGRLSLNPRAHLDVWGTVMLLIVGFGWGRPVVFDPYNLKNPLRDGALIALAGPVSNLILALVLSIVIPALTVLLNLPVDVMNLILFFSVTYNCMLAIFNLVPVYPLDGSKIIMALLPKTTALEYEEAMSRFGLVILFALIIPWYGQSPVSYLINPVITLLANFFMNLATAVASLL